MNMSRLQLLFDAHVNSNAFFHTTDLQDLKFCWKPFDDKPLLFWANHLLSTPLFECRFVVAFNANLKDSNEALP